MDPTVALCGGTVVVALDPPEVVATDVVLAGERVAALGAAPDGAVRRDCSGTLLIPGNVCAHHHLYSALSRGMPYRLAPPTSFTEVLQRIWWRLDRALDEGSIRASALRGGLDALLAGTTTIVDHHASPYWIEGSLDVIADALGELGVRFVLCYEVSDRDGPDRAREGIAENERFLATVRHRPLARGLVGAHASFTLSDDTLRRVVDAARGAGVGVHVHVSEDAVDAGAVTRLARAGVIDDRAVLAHGVHVTRAERELVAASGATVVVNPRSNMNNRVGHSPFTLGGARVAIGTDGIGGDLFAESQAGFFRAKEAAASTAGDWPLRRLAENGRLAGRIFDEPLLGTLRAGAPADVVVLGYPAPTPLDAHNLAGHWVFGLSAAHVRDVYVGGQLVVADGRPTRVDDVKVAADNEAQAEQLWERLESIPAHDFTPEGSTRR